MPSATALPAAAAAAAPAARLDLPDKLLEEIFVLLDDAADLARASGACTSFRRIISGRRFLRRFRSLHPPPVLGLLSWSSLDRGFYPAQAPHTSAPAAHAFSQAADFAFSFLPNPSSWQVRDVRDGRVLFSQNSTTRLFRFENLVVCDPLHRRRFQIPPIPGDLLASTGHSGKENFDPFLVPAGKEDDEEPSSIQVICNVMSIRNLGTFLFSSVTGEWRFVTSISIQGHVWMKYPSMSMRCYAHNCLYWIPCYHVVKVTFVLDLRRMEFSVIDVPFRKKKGVKAIVELAEGKLGLFILCENKLELNTWDHDAIGSKDCRLDHVVPLPNCCGFFAITIAEGYVLVEGFPQDLASDYHEKRPDVQYFTVEIKTLSVERLCAMKFGPGYLYAGLPPSLSLPSI